MAYGIPAGLDAPLIVGIQLRAAAVMPHGMPLFGTGRSDRRPPGCGRRPRNLVKSQVEAVASRIVVAAECGI